MKHLIFVLVHALANSCQKAETPPDEIPDESLASESVPVAAVNLSFSVDDLNESSIDAYVVGYPERLEAKKTENGKYEIPVPYGKQEIIITGAKKSSETTHGIRFGVTVSDESPKPPTHETA